MTPLWFKAKRYGWGWVPCSWEGWAVLAVAIVGLTSNIVVIDRYSQSGTDMMIASFVTNISIIILLIALCYAKGEKPRWRWGK
jgi:uncharacterized membrane protein